MEVLKVDLEATGKGVHEALKEFFRHPEEIKNSGLKGQLNNQKIIIQGFGNVGLNTAKSLYEDGSTIIGVAEIDGSIFNERWN